MFGTFQKNAAMQRNLSTLLTPREIDLLEDAMEGGGINGSKYKQSSSRNYYTHIWLTTNYLSKHKEFLQNVWSVLLFWSQDTS